MPLSHIFRKIINLINRLVERNPLAVLLIPLFYFLIMFAVFDQNYTWTGSGESNGSLWILLASLSPYLALKSLLELSNPVILGGLLILNLSLETLLIYIVCGWITPGLPNLKK